VHRAEYPSNSMQGAAVRRTLRGLSDVGGAAQDSSTVQAALISGVANGQSSEGAGELTLFFDQHLRRLPSEAWPEPRRGRLFRSSLRRAYAASPRRCAYSGDERVRAVPLSILRHETR